ncbi:MAG TPA: L-histidine N(alpha)-methyltransferase [Terracidiphilus sp.]
MNALASPAISAQIETPVGSAVRRGLSSTPKWLPPWLFYDETGSQLFERITELPEYYPTRIERSILGAHAGDMIARAADGERLRITELGAGSAAKTCLLLNAAIERQGAVAYEPIDVSGSALREAAQRIRSEIAGVTVNPRVMDYTNGLGFEHAPDGERRLVLYIGSSIGNFEPDAAASLLRRLRAKLRPGDAVLLGVDLAKQREVLLEAYDDAAGVTAAFNRNVLVRLNRELDANFNPMAFAHRAFWNRGQSRIEMHLESRRAQRVHFGALDMKVSFTAGETIHTENSYKYAWGQAETMLMQAGFHPSATWTDENKWFAVCLGRAS